MRGRPRETDEDRISMGLRIPQSLHARLIEAAAERELPANELVTWAIRDYLDRLIPVEEIKWTR